MPLTLSLEATFERARDWLHIHRVSTRISGFVGAPVECAAIGYANAWLLLRTPMPFFL